MSENTQSGPQTRDQVINTYFAEHRAKLLDVAAFLDRVGRAKAGTGDQEYRLEALERAVSLLTDGRPHRARRILELLSDHSAEIPQSAHGMKGAAGAVRLPPLTTEAAVAPSKGARG